jgi:hypothetical protein
MTETATPKAWDNGTPPHVNLAEALAAFQAELPKLTKDEKAKVKGETKDGRSYDRSYGYADLAQVVETVLPVLGKHGLSVTSKSTFDQQGNFILEVALLHESGEREIGYWPLPDPRRSGPQDIGSAMTYGRRYLTLALSGTYPGGEDDDGQKAQTSARERWEDAQPAQRHRPVDDRQREAGQEPQAASAPVKPPKKEWTDGEVYSYQAKMAASNLAMAVKGYDWMAGRDLHNRLVGEPDQPNTPFFGTATDLMAKMLADEAKGADKSVEAIEGLKIIATDRGLLKIQVSETETLDQALYEARELAVHAAAEQAVDATSD